jgi:glutaminase
MTRAEETRDSGGVPGGEVQRRGSDRSMRVHEVVPGPETSAVSTGRLPVRDAVRVLVEQAHRSYHEVSEGTVAAYIDGLAGTSPDLFGLTVTGLDGEAVSAGDSTHPFTIQSIAKPFVFALVCEALGHREVRELLGVNATGLPFDSVIAVELARDGLTNPMVNAGAIATTSLAPGRTGELKWQFLRDGLSRFAGRPLACDEVVLASERRTNGRNAAMARLLSTRERLYFDADVSTDVYTRVGSLLVDTADLSLMAATLAGGGVNPRTRERVVGPDTCRRTLALMVTAGLYELSGDWLYEVGLPAKSGVSGGIVTVAPGKGGMATFSPPLDRAGNSVRGQLATKMLSEGLGLDILASAPSADAPS